MTTLPWFAFPNHSDPARKLHGVDIQFGDGRAATLGEYLDDHGWRRALVVSGPHVAKNDTLVGVLRDALGDRLAGIYDGASQSKTLASIYGGIAALRDADADVVIGVGGGSSMVAARQIAAFSADSRDADAFVAEAQTGELAPPRHDRQPPAVILLPTSFAGADIASAGITEILPADQSPTGTRMWTSGVVTPALVLYDPQLFVSSPTSTLTTSAMNGFNKGIETLYAPGATPVSDAWAVHGLRLMTHGLPGLVNHDADAIAQAAAGAIFVQLVRFPAIIHAFGHGISRHSEVAQGLVHATVAPMVLEHVFRNVDGRRRLIASAMELDIAGRDDTAVATAIVDKVTSVRDGLAVPTRWRDIPDAADLDWDQIATNVSTDKLLKSAPVGITTDEAATILHALT